MNIGINTLGAIAWAGVDNEAVVGMDVSVVVRMGDVTSCVESGEWYLALSVAW